MQFFVSFFSKKAIAFGLISLFGICVAISQNVEFKKANFPDDKAGFKTAIKNIFDGDAHYKTGHFSLAVTHYLKANEFNANNALLNFRIGHCYLNSTQKLEALTYLEKSLTLDPEAEVFIYYLMGKAYHLNMDWDKSIEYYQLYIDKAPREYEDQKIFAQKRIEECQYGKQLIKDTIDVTIKKLGAHVNSPYADYCPLISADAAVMIFTSRRENTTGGAKDPELDVFYEDIYMTEIEDEKWTPAINIGPPVNTVDHNATVGFSIDGQKLYIFKNDNGDGNIYECDLIGDKWSEPVKLNKNINSRYKESHASFSYDERSIYFTSDRPDGIGGMDIYVSRLTEEGDWGEAENLGPSINTEFDEDAVFFHPDGKTMYFSSQGHKTMGGYDIFHTVHDDSTGKWSEPENVGFPINTPDDDAFFVVDASGLKGYYTSIKPDGFGEKDIYFLRFPFDSSKLQPQLVILKGKVFGDDGKALQATVEVVDLELNEVVAEYHSNSKSGKYLVSLPSGRNYGITVTAPGYLFHSENIDLPKAYVFEERINDIVLEELEVGKKVVLNNIFFDYDKATLKKESIGELDRIARLMDETPTMAIEISGHTDNKGAYGYNKDLSHRRAKSVVDYIIEHGIDDARLKYMGHAYDFPVASNDTEEGRALNRRTEFKVLGIIKKEEEFLDEPTVEKLHEIEDEIKKEHLVAETMSNGNGVPQQFKEADGDGNSIISSLEVIQTIDAFFEGDINMTVQDIIALIDYFFDQ
ncbi:MAG: hypothetical protein COA57_11680 [Flavobacteriales bacterium]|nr:MAG: hypothetical protein COA57_11680 [Flavobacteriales bacterium]